MYDHKRIESKWRKRFYESNMFKTDLDGNNNYYVLEMFFYPSGLLHMGHVRNYSIGDVIARYKKQNSYNVLHPMGADAFGLPAENAAIKNNMHPAIWTDKNINQMIEQLKSLGFSYDFNNAVITCKEDYYKWTQFLFKILYLNNLVYKKEAEVNFCPTCNTVLANEQVENGKCWRCDTPIIKKNLSQWFIKITDYADRLLNDLDLLDGWPEKVKLMQKNWIGKSQGAEITFKLENSNDLIVYTTQPDTLFGVSFIALSINHPLVSNQYQDFINKAKLINKNSSFTKEGIFINQYAIHPLTNKKIPIYVTNYVVDDYGTGAVMGVPSEDERDYEFAKKYDLSIILIYDNGKLINSSIYNGLTKDEAKDKIMRILIDKHCGKYKMNYKLKDWLISRQRYWGCPIPIVYCSEHGIQLVPDNELPVKLPLDIQFQNSKNNPLLQSEEFEYGTCPICGKPAKRETDTMDTFMCSSWYYFRYFDAHNSDKMFLKSRSDKWMPVNQYIGGIEHACLHLLYARFINKVLYDNGYINNIEPFANLLTQGMVIKDGKKMSKSLGNIVSPEDIIEQYGADTARLFILFAAPVDKDLDWSDEGIKGCYRFLNRIWNLPNLSFNNSDIDDKQIDIRLNKVIKNVTDNIESFKFHNAISDIMEFINYYSNLQNISNKMKQKSLSVILNLLYPFVPFIISEMSERLFISLGKWPVYKLIENNNFEVIVQINGKVRDKLILNEPITKELILNKSLKIQPFIENKKIIKTIIVSNKLINIVVK